MKSVVITIVLNIVLSSTFAQSANTLIGARPMGVGYASSCLTGNWSIFNNPAGIAKLTSTTASFAYDATPGFKPFNKAAATIASQAKPANYAVGAFRFGDKLYNEQVLAVTAANKLGLASLGLRASYVQYRAEGFGTYKALSVSLGGIAEITQQLHVGAVITNLNHPVINRGTSERLQPVMTLGILIKSSEKISLCSEVQKDLDHQTLWKTGLEYEFNKKFTVRSGFNLNPSAVFFGFGLNARRITVDYAWKYSTTLLSNHQCGVSYLIREKK